MNSRKYTLEVYRKDKRIKRNSNSVKWGKNKEGLRLIEKIDFEEKSLREIDEFSKSYYPASKKFVTQIYETYVTKKNLMTGKEFQERYDRPYYCSPSSSAYWSR